MKTIRVRIGEMAAAMDARIASDETAGIGERSIAHASIAARGALPYGAEDPEGKREAAARAAQLAFEVDHPGSLEAAREIERSHGRSEGTIQTPKPPVSGRLVIGHGKAGGWSSDASAIESADADLLACAKERGLFAAAQELGYATRDGGLLDDGWLLVVGAHVEAETLDADPSVIAYCGTATQTPVELKSWREVMLWPTDGGEWWVSYERPNRGRVEGNASDVLRALREYRSTGAIAGWYLADPSEYSDDDDALCAAGPKVERIDWTGFEAAIAEAAEAP